MTDIVIGAVEFGSYISIFKFLLFAAFFFAFIPVVGWIHDDSEELGIEDERWAEIAFAANVAAVILFMIIPLFIAGIAAYIFITAAAALIYVKQRNAKVMEFDKVLTSDHIKSLFSKEAEDDLEKEFTFITANKNEIPVPEPKTPEFHGYRITYEMLKDARERRASKISLAPAGDEYKVNFTIDEVDMPQPSLDNEKAGYLIEFVKHAADLDIKEKRKPQKGKFRIKTSGSKYEWQVTTAGSSTGQQAVLKDVTEYEIKKADELGFTDQQLEKLKVLKENQKGIFIVSGTAKSGTTTTVYGMLRYHDAFLNSIDALERKPIGDIPNINQFQYSMSDTGTTTYAKKLQSIIRMGPDIMAAIDCNDAESAKVACNAAESEGQLLYVSYKAENIANALAQWIKFIDDKKKALDNLVGVSNQRLIRNLCEECKQGYSPNKELLRKFNLPPEKAKVLYKPGKVQYDKRDREFTCPHCKGTGFYGVTAVFEILVLDDKTRDALKKAKTVKDINNVLRSANVTSLQQMALGKVLQGETSINEMIRVLQEKKKKK
jgi:type II secretory ATPase GspE/PulE/Tfp pilus assembly ATPase PilB-like protein